MRELTFKSYLKDYVKNMSLSQTLDITKLVSEVISGNTELEVPLVVYCLICDKKQTLLNVLRRLEYTLSVDLPEITEKDLKGSRKDVPQDFKNIYQNYLEIKKNSIIAHERKENLRKQILKLNKTRNMSMRKLSVVAGVDPSNFNTFMKNREYPKVSTERLEKVVTYLQEA